MKAATVAEYTRRRVYTISIHAAREGGDFLQHFNPFCIFSFQSTPPVKAATKNLHKMAQEDAAFQSTPPVKAATEYTFPLCQQLGISIHAAREGGDENDACAGVQGGYFNPRRP